MGQNIKGSSTRGQQEPQLLASLGNCLNSPARQVKTVAGASREEHHGLNAHTVMSPSGREAAVPHCMEWDELRYIYKDAHCSPNEQVFL